MKTSKLILAIFTFILVSTSFQACNNDNDYNYYNPNGLVTVKNLDENTFYMQIEDNVTLRPVNMTKNPYGKEEVRALISFEETKDDPGQFTKAAYIHRIKKILTKQPVPTKGEEDDKTYGNDPVEIMNSWATILEDNYLTLHFAALWGYSSNPHYVNLVTGTNPNDPYEVVFRHSVNGDYGDARATSLVAFSLKDLPDTGGKTVKLKLKWKSFTGEKTTVFDYNSSKSLTDKQAIPTIDSDFKTLK